MLGAVVFITGRRQHELEAALQELGDAAIGVRGDMGQLADLDQLFEQISSRYGRLDIVFANAGLALLWRLRRDEGCNPSVCEQLERRLARSLDTRERQRMFRVSCRRTVFRTPGLAGEAPPPHPPGAVNRACTWRILSANSSGVMTPLANSRLAKHTAHRS